MRGRAGWVVLGLAALWQQTCLAWRLPVCASSSGAPSQVRIQASMLCCDSRPGGSRSCVACPLQLQSPSDPCPCPFLALSGWVQRRPAADSCTRRSLVLEKGPALVLLGGLVMPSLARAADEEKKAEEIQVRRGGEGGGTLECRPRGLLSV